MEKPAGERGMIEGFFEFCLLLSVVFDWWKIGVIREEEEDDDDDDDDDGCRGSFR